MTKVLLGVIGVLVVILISIFIYGRSESRKLDQLNVQYHNAQQDVINLNESLKDRARIANSTDNIVDDILKQTNETRNQIDSIKSNVIATAKKEDKGEIQPSVADSVYLDSMWQTYCKANTADSHCSTSDIND
jgi:peptidoglycan hydrolase CwlO-like protein